MFKYCLNVEENFADQKKSVKNSDSQLSFWEFMVGDLWRPLPPKQFSVFQKPA